MSEERVKTHEELVAELRQSVRILQGAGRKDLLLQAIGVPLLEELRIEAARGQLSRLRITRDYRDELTRYYMAVSKIMDKQKVEESVGRLVDPFDNAINEKCSRIKNVFLKLMDEYSASYYVISSHTTRHIEGSNRIWYQRAKLITLPRHLVENLAAEEMKD